MVKAVFLDRDGVINRSIVRNGKPYPPSSLDELEILPGVAEGLAQLREAGYLLIVVTNQPDVATGKTTRALVDQIHEILQKTLPLDAIYACMEVDSESCRCYKPKPGMLLDAATTYGIDLASSIMIGDRWRDVGAGKNAGCRTIFIDCGYDERRPDQPDVTVSNFEQATAWILTQMVGEVR